MTGYIYKNFLLLILVGLFLSCGQTNHEADQIRFALAAVNGDIATVRQLVDKGGIDINAVNGRIGPALTSAAYGGHVEIVRFLLEKGADINVRGERDTTPLMNAAIGNQPDVARILLEKGADPLIALPDKDGKPTVTALTFARIRNSREMITILEEKIKEPK